MNVDEYIEIEIERMQIEKAEKKVKLAKLEALIDIPDRWGE